MPKSKGTGPATPKLKAMEKAKELVLDVSINADEAMGVCTRSRARRLSISVPDKTSPPKTPRRSMVSKKKLEKTPSRMLNEPMAKEKSSSPLSSVLADEINSASKDEEISNSMSSPKKRKVENKGNRNVPAGKLIANNVEEQDLSCKTTDSNLIESCGESVQDIIPKVPSTKRVYSRKSVLTLENIPEDNKMEVDMPSEVEPTKINGTGSITKKHKFVTSADGKIKEKPRKSGGGVPHDIMPRLETINVESSLPEQSETVLQPVSKKSVSPAKLSHKKTDVESVIEKTPKKLESPSVQKLGLTPPPVTNMAVSPGKLSNKKALTVDDSSLKKVESPLIEKVGDSSPAPKKLTSPTKLSAKKAAANNESTPKKTALPTFEKLPKSPLPVLKKPTSPAKLLTKKAVIEDDTDSDEDSDAESRKEIMRSAEKRIIRNLSTSESESRNHVKVLQLPVVDVVATQQMETSSDSDSAPEDVTFDASRQSALELLKQTVDSIKRDKQKKKEKRKERLDIWRQRKEENLIRLKESKANKDDASCSSSEESLHERNGQLKNGALLQGKKTYFVDEPSKSGLKRLPQEVVNSLPDQLPKIPKTSATKKRVENVKGKVVKKPKVVNEKKEKIEKGPNFPNFKRDVDFIPLTGSSTTQFGVVALDKPTLKTVAQQAANFKQNLLFGSRICRVPASTQINNRKKIQVNMK